MGRRIISSLFAMALIFSLPVFSLADGGEVILMDSGSPAASTFSLRQSASTMSTRAVTLPDAPEGYHWELYSHPNELDYAQNSTFFYAGRRMYNLPAGTYFSFMTFSIPAESGYVYSPGISQTTYPMTDAYSFGAQFSFSETREVRIFGRFPGTYNPNTFAVTSFDLYKLTPNPIFPEGTISSGFIYSSGTIQNTTRSIFGTIDASFGNVVAGKYLINIYHWGDSYNVRFQMHDGTEQIFYPTSTSGGVTTYVFNHSGGELEAHGSFTVDNIETTAADGYYATSGSSTVGDVDWHGPLSWTFNIKDIVAVPLEIAEDDDFGIFSLIVGFLRDKFDALISVFGDDQSKSYVDQAQDSLNKEVEELGQLSTDLTTQTGNLEQQFTSDFAIPSEVLGQTGAVQQIYNFLFSSLGIFSIFIWLPVVLAVIKKLLRL